MITEIVVDVREKIVKYPEFFLQRDQPAWVSIPNEHLELLAEAVASLPVRVRVPSYSPTTFPRYYFIAARLEGDKAEIIDIVGLKSDGTPSKWSYRFGYWHPYVQHFIARALKRYAQQKQAQQIQQQ